MREPGGTLIELATDGPGFTVDEDADHLGETLLVPPYETGRAADIKVMLPQFGRPGEPRPPRRDLPFVHRFYTPDEPNDDTIIVLHGSGGNEADLMPFAHRVSPHASILGVRGRATEEGSARWFRRFTLNSFDQNDIHSEAEAFNAFIQGAVSGYRLDPERITFIGLSNGANFAAAVMALYPDLIRRAILLRAIPVLDSLPDVDLSGAQVLLLDGIDDPFARNAPALANWLRERGAALEQHQLEGGHSLTEADTAAAKAWHQQYSPPSPFAVR